MVERTAPEVEGACAITNTSPERIHQWTPTRSGTATLSTCGTATLYDSVVYVRRGGCTGTEVGCNDDTIGCNTGEPNTFHGSRISLAVTAGQTYYVFVDGFAGRSGTYRLQVVAP